MELKSLGYKVLISIVGIVFALHNFSKPPYLELEVLTHVQEYERICKCKVQTNIQFGDAINNNPYIAGMCTMFGGVLPNNIYINKSYWTTLDYESQELLIFHELGHCQLFKNHNEKLIPYSGSLPQSFMYPSIFYYPYSYRSYYMKELFEN